MPSFEGVSGDCFHCEDLLTQRLTQGHTGWRGRGSWADRQTRWGHQGSGFLALRELWWDTCKGQFWRKQGRKQPEIKSALCVETLSSRGNRVQPDICFSLIPAQRDNLKYFALIHAGRCHHPLETVKAKTNLPRKVTRGWGLVLEELGIWRVSICQLGLQFSPRLSDTWLQMKERRETSAKLSWCKIHLPIQTWIIRCFRKVFPYFQCYCL